jgi:hypothetical protein
MKQKAEPVISTVTPHKEVEEITNEVGKAIHAYHSATLWVLIVVVVGTVGFLIADNYRNAHKSLMGVCSDSLLSKAASGFIADQQSQLASTVTTIKTLPHYQQDPNCMFVVTISDINEDNLSAAQSSLNLFNKYYNGQKLNPSLLNYTSVATLRKDVVALSNQEKVDNERFNALSNAPPEYQKP